jgi:ribonucleoside-triphosphate reductase
MVSGSSSDGIFSFKLSDDFVSLYRDKKPPFGYKDAAGNSVGEITFLRTYSRKKSDGTKETWVDVCERVINGMYSLQKDHCKKNRLPWNGVKAQASAKEAFDRLFNLKWTPPGRGLWIMGTPLVNVHKNSAALQNCAFVSTSEMSKDNPAEPFAFLMEASMLGVGVGFDDKGADKDFTIYEPNRTEIIQFIDDSREGWRDSTVDLINSYLKPEQNVIKFDYSLIRPFGTPIQTFGGTASGPEPLMKLHKAIRKMFDGRGGEKLTRKDIADIGNLIGVCVVSGNVRRSAELLIGRHDDQEFLNLKNSEIFPERNSYDPENPGWAWMSNNSVETFVGNDLSHLVDNIALNGEPGVIWLDMSRKYGRLIDPPNNKDWRVAGYNPCAEQSLESYECCTLVETYLNRHESLEDYKRTLKFAYLYAKTVTLLPTHWEKTNAIMQRNRRIGTSMSGIANFADIHGIPVLREWMDSGYDVIKRYDNIYSEWFGIRESINLTTVKPSGTVSILAG